jgi:hypothetical protein
MKRLIAVVILMAASSLMAQVSNPSIIPTASNPSGNACTAGVPMLYYSGTYYGCDGTGHYVGVGEPLASANPSSAYTFSTDGTTITATPNRAGLATYTGTDATVVIQQAIAADAANCGTFYFRNGTYNFNTAQVITPPYDAAIILPAVVSTNVYCQWKFVGETQPVNNYPGFAGLPAQNTGVVFYMTPALITSIGTDHIAGIYGASSFLYSYAEIDGIDVRFPTNQRGNERAFDMSAYGNVVFKDDNASFVTVGFPSAAGNVGFYGPGGNEGNTQQFYNLYASGEDECFNWGSEHTFTNGINCGYSNSFGQYSAAYHPSLIMNVVDQENTNGLSIVGNGGNNTVNIIGWDIETAAAHPRSSNFTEQYPGTWNGEINYTYVDASIPGTVCPSNVFSSGGDNFTQTCANQMLGAKTAPALVASTFVTLSATPTTTVTSPSVTLAKNTLVLVMCVGYTGITSNLASASTTETWNALGFQSSGGTNEQVSWAMLASTAARTFTCTQNTSNPYQGMVVVAYAGTFGTINTSASATPSGGSYPVVYTYTGPAITPTARTLTIFCTALQQTGTFLPGVIGGVPASLSGVDVSGGISSSSAGNACEAALVPAGVGAFAPTISYSQTTPPSSASTVAAFNY